MTKGLPPGRRLSTLALCAPEVSPDGSRAYRGWMEARSDIKSHFPLNNGNLKQSLTKYSLETKWNPQPVFINKVLLACSHTHFLWLVCVCFHIATAELQQRLFGPVCWLLPWRVISIRLLFKRSTKIGTVQQYMSCLCYIYHSSHSLVWGWVKTEKPKSQTIVFLKNKIYLFFLYRKIQRIIQE